MNTAVKCQPRSLLVGDRVILEKNHTWVITNIVGPDRLQTYDLFLIDDYGNTKQAIVTEPVTILM